MPVAPKGYALHRALMKACTLCLLLGASLALSVAQAQYHALIVSGLGGNASYDESFKTTGETMAAALQSLDTADNLVVHLHDSPTRENVLLAIEAAAGRMNADQTSTFTLVLVGHGTASANSWKFNIAGPDITTEDLVGALNAVPAQQQVVILAASSSGATLEALSQSQRVVVTATKSGGEANAVRFPGFLAEAVESGQADYDRNEILTVAEAFRFAQSRTTDYYGEQKLLASEHARLRGDDAASIPLALLGSLKDANDDPVVATLLTERLTLEEQFKQLKESRQDMPLATYYSELETLLISIAQLQQSIDAQTGWSDNDAEI